MKHLFPSLFLAITVLILAGCMTEQEKAVQARIAKLDEQYRSSEANLKRFFQAMETLQQQIQPQEPVSDTNGLSAEEKATFLEMDERFQFMRPQAEEIKAIGVQPAVNSIGLWLNPEAKANSASHMVQYLRYVDVQMVFRVMDRMEEGKWHWSLSEPDEMRSEKARDEDAHVVADQMRELADCRYLLGFDERLLIGGRMVEESKFESGRLFGKMYIFDLEKQEIVKDFYAIVRNSGIVFTFTDNKKSKEQELIADLRNDLFVNLRNRLDDE